jgi:hypothetical protein
VRAFRRVASGFVVPNLPKQKRPAGTSAAGRLVGVGSKPSAYSYFTKAGGALQGNDDVQSATANFEISDALMAKLQG